MTTLADQDFRSVKDIEDVRDLFETRIKEGENFENSFGVEEEAFFLDKETLKQASDAQNKALFAALSFKASPEPNAAQLEHVSDPYTFDNLGSLLDQMHRQRVEINAACEKIGLIRCPFSTMPHVNGQEAFSNIIQPSEDDPTRGERQIKLMRAFFNAMPKSPVYPVLNTALHYTTSVESMDDDLKRGRRMQYLMPFLLILMENRSPFNACDDRIINLGTSFNQSIDARKNLEKRGCIDTNYFAANTGEELAQLKFFDVLHTPMMAYYGLKFDGSKNQIPSFEVLDARTEELVQFRDMMHSSLGFRTNYYMSRSQSWNWLKSKNLFDKETGDGVLMLQERRDFDPGIHQINTMSLIMAALDCDPNFALEIDDLLETFGFKADFWEDNGLMMVQKSARAAYYRGNPHYNGTDEFMNISYGNGKMNEFAKFFMERLDEFYHGTEFSKLLDPMRYIIQTEQTDAQVAHMLIIEQEDNLDFIRGFDPSWFERPNTCLGMLVDNGEFKGYEKRRYRSYHVPKPANDTGVKDDPKYGEPT